MLHLTEAFHGRTGYTMSLTNTEPGKVARFPKFDWPRIDSPVPRATGGTSSRPRRRALDQARRAFAENPHDIACFIAEPIQGEGGDHHFRPEFLQAMAGALPRERRAVRVRRGADRLSASPAPPGRTSSSGVHPDVVAFGKKTQVCGIMAGGRVDEIPDNVFAVSSRINSTWGGNLTDMVRVPPHPRGHRGGQAVDRARMTGAHLLERLRELAARIPSVTEPRGRGLMCAITLPSPQRRDRVVADLGTGSGC